MCDYGRTMYEHLNAENRLATPLQFGKPLAWQNISAEILKVLQKVKSLEASQFALVLTPQYTNEEYDLILSRLSGALNFLPKVYIWRDSSENIEEFDSILLRGDKNPNTAGLQLVLNKYGIVPVTLKEDFSILANQNPLVTLVFGPEIEKSYTQFPSELARFTELPEVIYFGTTHNSIINEFSLAVPTKVFSEKKGTFTNYQGREQKLNANPPVFPAMLGIEQIFWSE
jgi:NADH-quinone oxidoreductase subunit G